MAMKEDILEQIVEDYLLHKGYFVQHNLKFRPRKDHPDFKPKQDSVHSDIDVLGYHPSKTGHDKVWVVSCKSWLGGFYPSGILEAILDNKKLNGRDAWKGYRELTCPKWSEAFLNAIKDATGEDCFTYFLAVTRIKTKKGKKAKSQEEEKRTWESHKPFQEALDGNPHRIITLREMTDKITGKLAKTGTPETTEVGRMIQLFLAAETITAPKTD
ncbi:MAG: hypothetical protein F4154_00955 [Candidatus Dadabacteria bacterium]|nr:hypothetical protein [Candidatus Dadabacteria bacterium]